MDIDRLQELWKTQPTNLPPLPDAAALLVNLKSDAAEFDLTIRQRDRRELRTGLLYGGFFTVLVLTAADHETVWPFAAAAGGMAAVMLFLVGEKGLARLRQHPPRETLLGELAQARAEVSRQRWLLRHVAWWYVLPAQVAWWCFGLGVQLIFPWTLPLWAAVALMALWTGYLVHGGVSVWRLNQQEVETSLEPRLKELDALSASFADEGSAGRSGSVRPDAGG